MATTAAVNLYAFLCAVLVTCSYGDIGYNINSPNGEETNGFFSETSLRNEGLDITEEDSLLRLAEVIPGGGTPGEDYPILSSIPETSFTCEEQEYPGYYADTSEDSQCQVFHICQEGGEKSSFLCPIGTLFQQEYFVCNWWFNVDCQNSDTFFRLNADIGKVPENDFDSQARAETLQSNSFYNREEQEQEEEEDTTLLKRINGNGEARNSIQSLRTGSSYNDHQQRKSRMETKVAAERSSNGHSPAVTQLHQSRKLSRAYGTPNEDQIRTVQNFYEQPSF